MLDAVSFGPLAPGHGRAIEGDTAVDLLKLFDKTPDIANAALAKAARAVSPKAVVEAAKLFADPMRTLESADGTYKLDKPGLHDGDAQQRTKQRAAHVGAELLKDDGTLDFAKGKKALADLMFHPTALEDATPALAMHMRETIGFLEGNRTARDTIKDMATPSHAAVRGLLARGSGKDPSAIGKADARQAGVNAMLTPVYQGDVGSCFAIAGIVRPRQTDPERAVKVYADLATKGTSSRPATSSSMRCRTCR